MKIRMDFVTNSSSSCFTVIVKVIDTAGKEIKYEQGPMCTECGEIEVDSNFIYQLKKATSLEEICDALDRSVQLMIFAQPYEKYREGLTEEEKGDGWVESFTYEAWEEFYQQTIQEKQEFRKKVTESFSKVKDIEKVIIEGCYENVGEFCECSALNDRRLKELATKVMNSDGEEKTKAIQGFVNYVKNSNYFVLPNVDSVETIAENLCSNVGPEREEITTFQELNIKSGRVSEHTEYYL